MPTWPKLIVTAGRLRYWAPAALASTVKAPIAMVQLPAIRTNAGCSPACDPCWRFWRITLRRAMRLKVRPIDQRMTHLGSDCDHISQAAKCAERTTKGRPLVGNNWYGEKWDVARYSLSRLTVGSHAENFILCLGNDRYFYSQHKRVWNAFAGIKRPGHFLQRVFRPKYGRSFERGTGDYIGSSQTIRNDSQPSFSGARVHHQRNP